MTRTREWLQVMENHYSLSKWLLHWQIYKPASCTAGMEVERCLLLYIFPY